MGSLQQRYSAKRTWVKWAFLMVAITVLAIGVVRSGWLSAPYPVKTAVVSKGSIRSFITVSGKLISTDQMSLASPVTARVTSIAVKEGATIKQEQTLLHFDARDVLTRIEERQAVLSVALEVQQSAKLDWESLAQIYELGGESKKSVTDAQLKLHSAVRDVNAIQSEIRRQRFELERFSVKSPITGIVTAVPANKGSWVSQGEVLMKLSGSASREIEVKIDSGDTNTVSLGKVVTLSSEAYPGTEWTGKITWIAPATKMEGSSNTLDVRVSLSDRAPHLVLGQQVDVNIPTASADDVLVIPSVAVSTRQGKSSVAVIENGAIRFVPVILGISELKSTEVKNGLSAGQIIVLPDGKPLKEGDKVYSETASRNAT